MCDRSRILWGPNSKSGKRDTSRGASAAVGGAVAKKPAGAFKPFITLKKPAAASIAKDEVPNGEENVETGYSVERRMAWLSVAWKFQNTCISYSITRASLGPWNVIGHMLLGNPHMMTLHQAASVL